MLTLELKSLDCPVSSPFPEPVPVVPGHCCAGGGEAGRVWEAWPGSGRDEGREGRHGAPTLPVEAKWRGLSIHPSPQREGRGIFEAFFLKMH